MESKKDGVVQEQAGAIDTNPTDEIQQLIEIKARCIQEGNYIQAEAIKQKIKDLQGNTEFKKKKDLDSQHAQELKQLEDSYNKEIVMFKESWENKLKALEAEAEEREQNLNMRHQKELETLYSQIEQSTKLFKHSPAYLELRQCEAECVKQELFLEAHQFKIKADHLAKEEEERFTREKNDKIKKKVDLLMKEQEEKKAEMINEINFQFENERKFRDIELEKLVQKYKNQKLALELQQKQEKLYATHSNILRAKTSYQFHREPSARQRGKQCQEEMKSSFNKGIAAQQQEDEV